MGSDQTTPNDVGALKGCPFCGGTEIADEDCSDMHQNGTQIACDGCGASIRGWGSSSCYRNAVTAWNRRADGAGWVRCSDRNPEHDGRYLVLYRSGDRPHLRAFVGDWLSNYGWSAIVDDTVIVYWSEIPAPPKGEGL